MVEGLSSLFKSGCSFTFLVATILLFLKDLLRWSLPLGLKELKGVLLRKKFSSSIFRRIGRIGLIGRIQHVGIGPICSVPPNSSMPHLYIGTYPHPITHKWQNLATAAS